MTHSKTVLKPTVAAVFEDLPEQDRITQQEMPRLPAIHSPDTNGGMRPW